MGLERVRSTICWVYRLGRAPQPAGALLPTQTSALVVPCARNNPALPALLTQAFPSSLCSDVPSQGGFSVPGN